MIKNERNRLFMMAILAAGMIFVINVKNIRAEEISFDEQDVISENSVSDSFDAVDEEVAEITEESLYEETGNDVQAFVTRLYEVCLDRKPDKNGLDYWTGRLESKEISGCEAAHGFIFSEEFMNKNYCNECFLKQMYKAFMGREYDKGGLDYWLKNMSRGMTREEVFNGFAFSEEFKALCEQYGIETGEPIEVPEYGTVPHGKCTKCGEIDGVTAFVTRLYNVCFGRKPDDGGLKTWTDALWSHERTGSSVAEGFVFSEEFTNMDLNSYEFIKYMYKAFFDREGDPSGINYWMTEMAKGMNKSHVFSGFVNSEEFKNLCDRYGIVQGKYIPVNDKLTPESVRKMSYFARWYLISDGRDEYYISESDMQGLLTNITVPVWDFESTRSMNKVSKSLTLTINKNIAEYAADAFNEIYASPDKPVIKPKGSYCYYYRANVNNTSRLSNHSYGIAIDLNPSYNKNGDPMVTKEAWEAMDESSVSAAQKKAYTIYEGCTIYNILCEKYGFGWGGYFRTTDAMHFEF